ncbi:MAG TPA: hypothetical protein PKC89_10460 [Pyrinomonadaceae bacterium]|nr:hypothetical protein [Pyrinomonadaceae bacterium]
MPDRRAHKADLGGGLPPTMPSNCHGIYAVDQGRRSFCGGGSAADKILSLLTELHRSISRRVPRVAAEAALPWAIFFVPYGDEDIAADKIENNFLG